MVGRITLFNVREEDGKINQPTLRGVLETPDGKYTVTLWEEKNKNVTKGVYYKGQVKSDEEEMI
jgi:hypothetical protein